MEFECGENTSKRRKISESFCSTGLAEESTEFKLALLESLHPEQNSETHLEYLLAHDGDVEKASEALGGSIDTGKRKRSSASRANGYQSTLSFASRDKSSPTSIRQVAKKGTTAHLYSPEDIERHTPCSIIHNVLPSKDADELLRELISELPSFTKDNFKLFDRVVTSPHTSRFYVDNYADIEDQQSYLYNGQLIDVSQTTPKMLEMSCVIRDITNQEIKRRIKRYPGGKKLKFQADPETDPWKPNASFVNCYDGPEQSVGYHTDQLTYLGVRPTIASLSLGVSREFRIRKIVPEGPGGHHADERGQIAIHLPHNSLLIMHAECQEEWKHSIAPARSVTPHPIAENKRLNITYRYYKEFMRPQYSPRCQCRQPALLRYVQKNSAGRYFWACQMSYVPGQSGCPYWTPAEFDSCGRPSWAEGYTFNSNKPPDQDKSDTKTVA